jgi:DNA-binding response OmpR family regulator
MANALEIRALMVTSDPWLLTSFANVSRELGIETQKSGDPGSVPDELSRAKYEALLLDFDTVAETMPIFVSVRESRTNKDALVFAVATGTAHRQQALDQGATFIFERPFASAEIRRALSSTYDRMARGRRRYFRFAAVFPALLTPRSSGMKMECSTINISSSGMAVNTPSPLNPGEIVDIALVFPDSGSSVETNGTVVWDDKHGKAGISLQGIQTEIDCWLDRGFSQLIHQRRLDRLLGSQDIPL